MTAKQLESYISKSIKNKEQELKDKIAYDLWLSLYPLMVQNNTFIPIEDFYFNHAVDERNTDDIQQELKSIENKFKKGAETDGII